MKHHDHDNLNLNDKHRRKGNEYGDGYKHGFTPLQPLDLSRVKTIDDLVRAMSSTAFGGRRVGEAADTLEAMVRDKDCFVIMTLSGAMTVAKMGLVICDMIERGMVNAIVSTGALMAHGFIEAAGMKHFKYEEGMDDTALYKAGYDRVYDTLELEKNLDDAETIIMKVLDSMDRNTTLSSRYINEKLGEYLHKNIKGRGVLSSAYANKIPVYVPGFTDSELGLDIGVYNRRAKSSKEKPFDFNPFLDLEHYTELIKAQKKLGIFTIGGGVPRNWAQQVGPYLDIIDQRLGFGGAFKRFQYAVRICPEPVHWGGLSGCTYSEGVSWGKFVPREEGGQWTEVLSDATIAWPIIVKAVIERLEKNPKASATKKSTPRSKQRTAR
jgi:deoxyhypusine synthase